MNGIYFFGLNIMPYYCVRCNPVLFWVLRLEHNTNQYSLHDMNSLTFSQFLMFAWFMKEWLNSEECRPTFLNTFWVLSIQVMNKSINISSALWSRVFLIYLVSFSANHLLNMNHICLSMILYFNLFFVITVSVQLIIRK